MEPIGEKTPDITSYYSELTRDELVRLLLDKDEEIRLGQVFTSVVPEESLDATLQWRGRQRFLAEKVMPVKLVPVNEKSCFPEKGDNLIIDGDNLPVMASLLKDYRGAIDVIYMDPPYNTGGDVFPYNDDFSLSKKDVLKARREKGRSIEIVSLDDPSRHTKWINHIAPRLWAAKKLMKQTGVIILSIDEHELPRLWMLMEEIFGEKNRIATLVWERARKNDATYISEGHEYMLVWARNINELNPLVSQKGKWREIKPGLDFILNEYKRLREVHGEDFRAITAGLKEFTKGIKKGDPLWTVRQYVGVDSRSDEFGPYKEDDPSWPGPGGPRYNVYHPETKRPVKIPTNGWRFSDPTDIEELIKDDRIVWKLVDRGIPKIKKYLLEGRDVEVQTSVIQKEARGAVLLSKAIFGNDKAYKNPKDHELLARLFNLVTWHNPNALFLDPYAGSGTTGHSVISMNAQDHGKRRFILVEGGYVSKNSTIKPDKYTDTITAERIRRVITGKWANKKPHPKYDTGFTYFIADKTITKADLLASDRESLADIILQIADEESNRIDCRVRGYKYLIGHTRSGLGLALVWQPGKDGTTLTMEVLKEIVKEAEKQGCTKPIHVYAAANEGPVAEHIYRFHQIPDAILAKLGINGTDGEEEFDEDE
jgi:adenine-specific DNA-methyltransferase